MWHYFLFFNKIAPSPDDCRAHLVSRGSMNEEDIIDYMIERGSTVTKAEARKVLDEFGAAIISLLQEGYTINTPLVKILPSVGGVFTDENDAFDPTRHQFKLNISAGDRLAAVPKLVRLKKIESTTALPSPLKLRNNFRSPSLYAHTGWCGSGDRQADEDPFESD